MPFEKNKTDNYPGRPRMPSLSTNNKASETSLTPRLAGASTTASISPILRRGTQNEKVATPKSTLKEDISTPIKAFLASNITPRSSSRKARRDSVLSTPNVTPTHTPTGLRPASTIDAPRLANGHTNGVSGLGIEVDERIATRRRGSMVSESNNSNLSYSSRSTEGYRPAYGQEAVKHPGWEISPKFFHASEVQSKLPGPEPPRRPPSPTKSSSFVYASGEEHQSAPTLTTARLEAANERQAQRIHTLADYIPDDALPVKNYSRPHAALVSLPSQQLVSHFASNRTKSESVPSPPRETQLPRPSFRQTYSPVVTPSNRKASISHSRPPSRQSSQSNRRHSLDTQARRISHVKSASMGSLDTTPSRRRSLREPLRMAPSPTSPASLTSPDVTHMSSPSNSAEISRENKSNSSAAKRNSLRMTGSPLQSPNRNTFGEDKLHQMNELAANARRERKVLDLEISNSSLLAINKTLEREMRKQNAELRRYRRLTLAGRVSIATSTCSLAEGLNALPESDNGAELSETMEEEDEDGQDDLSADDANSIQENTMSPHAITENDARYKAENEQRLQLDLSKHQDLLIDSQKMNQSIKRCLNWTEELIFEGKKALEYTVRVSDIELGGRILVTDDREDVIENLHADADADIFGAKTSESELASMSWDYAGRSPMSSERDSGVDLELARKFDEEALLTDDMDSNPLRFLMG
ncbi:MAG: hypothetical protein M1827_007200 [Pycnora praestabilis]|nr:MAG: hypothetical protein M1827_007200 [Pycnora praestabilis]